MPEQQQSTPEPEARLSREEAAALIKAIEEVEREEAEQQAREGTSDSAQRKSA